MLDNTTFNSAGGGVFACPASNAQCPTPAAFVAGPAFGFAQGITADATDVYFASATTPQGIYRCAIGGCNGSPVLVYSASAPQNVANDATSIFWTDGGAGVWRGAK
jgi:hypothetical protein